MLASQLLLAAVRVHQDAMSSAGDRSENAGRTQWRGRLAGPYVEALPGRSGDIGTRRMRLSMIARPCFRIF